MLELQFCPYCFASNNMVDFNVLKRSESNLKEKMRANTKNNLGRSSTLFRVRSSVYEKRIGGFGEDSFGSDSDEPGYTSQTVNIKRQVLSARQQSLLAFDKAVKTEAVHIEDLDQSRWGH